MAKSKDDGKHKSSKVDRKTEAADISNFDNFVDSITKDVQTITRVEANTEVRWLSCFNVSINLALSGHPEKGLPVGRIINFEGESDTGKTLLALTSIRETQNQYGSFFRCLVIDVERGMDLKRNAALGICVTKKPKNPKKPNIEEGEDDKNDPRAGTFKVIQCSDVSTLGDTILPPFLAAARAHPEMMFILMIDSVSMLVTEHERTTDFETRDMSRAQELRKLMRLINDGFSANLTIFLIHHQTDRIATGGAMLSAKTGSHGKDIGGGKAMKFVPSVRLEVSYGGKEKRGTGENEEIIGQKCRIEVIKTRMFKPMLRAETYIDHNVGFTQLGGLADQLVQQGVVVEAGSMYQVPALFGEKKWFWKNLEQELEKPENARKVVELIVDRMQVAAFDQGKGEPEPETDPLDLDALGAMATRAADKGKAKKEKDEKTDDKAKE
jgi:RecA/RadA recombinase